MLRIFQCAETSGILELSMSFNDVSSMTQNSQPLFYFSIITSITCLLVRLIMANLWLWFIPIYLWLYSPPGIPFFCSASTLRGGIVLRCSVRRHPHAVLWTWRAIAVPASWQRCFLGHWSFPQLVVSIIKWEYPKLEGLQWKIPLKWMRNGGTSISRTPQIWMNTHQKPWLFVTHMSGWD
jgi:hypothetical protein